MSEEDTQPTVESEARGAEHRENLAMTDARRAEEEVAHAEEEREKAEEKEEKLFCKERKAREKAERVHAEADRMRAQAQADAVRVEAEARAKAESTVSGARVASPGVGTATEPDTQAAAADGTAAPPFPGADKLPEAAQRPEVMVGAAFAGSFVIARILKRIFD
jgi:hypothetical protein